MSERAALKGGRLRTGGSDDGFAVRLWLPTGLPAGGTSHIGAAAKSAS
jgi:hypothetical protein